MPRGAQKGTGWRTGGAGTASPAAPDGPAGGGESGTAAGGRTPPPAGESVVGKSPPQVPVDIVRLHRLSRAPDRQHDRQLRVPQSAPYPIPFVTQLHEAMSRATCGPPQNMIR